MGSVTLGGLQNCLYLLFREENYDFFLINKAEQEHSEINVHLSEYGSVLPAAQYSSKGGMSKWQALLKGVEKSISAGKNLRGVLQSINF